MLATIHFIALYIHIIIGGLALVIFWLPIISKKGSKNHLRFGKLFTKGMYTVAVSGIIMSSIVLFDPIGLRYPDNNFSEQQIQQVMAEQRIFAGFLLMLSVLVFSNVKQSLMVLKAKRGRSILKTPSHLLTLFLLGTLGIVMLYIGWQQHIILFQVFAVLSVVNSIGCFRYIYKKTIRDREWIMVHLGNIIGAGIGAYTAFFAFGGRRFFSEILTGELQIIPWILPSVVGVSVMIYFNRMYRVKYRIG
jgi:hypothetical protein